MKTVRYCPAILAVLLLAANSATGQIELFSQPAPEDQQSPARMTEAPTTTSRLTGDKAVSIPLDDTGVGDWRFINPRRPQSVTAGTVIEFENRTADRIFQVTTTLSLRPGEFLSAGSVTLPSTVPLLIYDALIDGRTTADCSSKTIGECEQVLIERAQREFPDLSCLIGEVLEIESALRVRADKAKAEDDARKALLKAGTVVSESTATIDTATKNHKDAVDALEAADEKLAILKGDGRAGGTCTVAVESESPVDYLAERREELIKVIDARKAALLKQRKPLPARPSEEEKKAYAEATRKIALQELAVDTLKAQSAETAQLIPLRLALPGIRSSDCSISTSTSCAVSIYIYPNSSDFFPYEVLLLQADPGPARFNVKFFEEEESPARQTAYLVARERAPITGAPKSSVTLSAVASFSIAQDPFVEDLSAKSRNCPFLCEDRPYKGEHSTRTGGTGRVEITQSYGNLLDGKVSLTFKEGDFGNADDTGTTKLSQYRFNIYSEPGVTFHYGKFPFLSGIAINETGEGGRLAYHNYSLSYIAKRESKKNAIGVANRDNAVWFVEANNISIPAFFDKFKQEEERKKEHDDLRLPLRTLNLVYLRGDDRRGPEKDRKDTLTELKETVFRGHDYQTFGGQIGYAVPRIVYGTLSGYHSKRDADEKNAPCGNDLYICDGKGYAYLLTATHPFTAAEDGKSKGNIAITAGLGSGDDPATPSEDEGYIGETPGFAPDFIFLSSFAGAISQRDFIDFAEYKDRKEEFRALDLGVVGLGRGLSNKTYYGLKFTHNGFSPLAWLARRLFFIPKSDIRSQATLITFNHYELRRPIAGSHFAGRELDIELNVETPRGVKVFLKGGYFRPGPAVERFIKDDVWSASTGLSLSL